jgi:hypothetical protein
MEYTKKETEEYNSAEKYSEEERFEEEVDEGESAKEYPSCIPILGISVVIAMEMLLLYFSLGTCVSEKPLHLDL